MIMIRSKTKGNISLGKRNNKAFRNGDDKGFSNILIVSLSTVLVLVAISVLWYFISPTLSRVQEGFNDVGEKFSPMGNITPIEKGNATIEKSGDCELVKAYWDKTSALENNEVKIIVEGKDCDGKTIQFRVFEDDSSTSDDPANFNPPSAMFNGSIVTTLWIAEWQNDCNGFCNPPEYYFEAFFADKKITYKKSDGSEITLTLNDIEKRLFDLSFDPNHPPELRWGAPVGSDERLNMKLFATPLRTGESIEALNAYELEKGLRYYLRAHTYWKDGVYLTRTAGLQGSAILK